MNSPFKLTVHAYNMMNKSNVRCYNENIYQGSGSGLSWPDPTLVKKKTEPDTLVRKHRIRIRSMVLILDGNSERCALKCT